MKMTFHRISQTGTRDSNQDTTGVLLDAQRGCFVVCDGVAGTAGGERAASIARDTLLDQVAAQHTLTPAVTAEMITACEQAIQHQQLADPRLQKMSTTLAALFIDRLNLQAWWFHAGDSRIYHFRRGVVHDVTRDHSLVQKLQDSGCDNGRLNSHLLYNALGAHRPQSQGHSPTIALQDGDVFLLCSDGFWNVLTQYEMELALRMVNSPQEWLALMLKSVDHLEIKDNLSAVAVWCGSPQETTLLFSATDSAHFLPSRD